MNFVSRPRIVDYVTWASLKLCPSLQVATWCFNVILRVDFIHFSYKERFLAALPPSRRASTDFGRPVFTAAAFYLCAKRHKVLACFSNSVLCCSAMHRRFVFFSAEAFLNFLAAQSWQTKADRSMWHIQHWVYNGTIYSYPLCLSALSCNVHLCCVLTWIVYCTYALFLLSCSDYRFQHQWQTSALMFSG